MSIVATRTGVKSMREKTGLRTNSQTAHPHIHVLQLYYVLFEWRIYIYTRDFVSDVVQLK